MHRDYGSRKVTRASFRSGYMEGSEVLVGGRRFRFPPPPPLYDYAYYLDEPRPSTSTGGLTSSTSLNLNQPSTSQGDGQQRHSFTSRYGTQENLYEEITPHPDQEEELRYVHSKHIQVLSELNLSMEAMIMPDEETARSNDVPQEATSNQLLSSPGSCHDSGFSSSSTGSNSLGRPTPSMRKFRQPLWKRLHNPLNPKKPQNIDQLTSNEVRSHSGSWEESSRDTSRRSSCSDVDFSSGDESNRCSSLEGVSTKGMRGGSKRCSWRLSSSPEPGGGLLGANNTPAGRFARWFSIKKPTQSPASEQNQTVPYKGKMPLLLEEEECSSTSRRLMAPSLPPPPPTLSQQQLKMRHIVEAIVQSENSYLNTLHRLVYDYKKPLEEMSPAILNNTKIVTLFYRVPEILQCHTLFRIALAEAVANWDRDQKIGDVFIASFSKAVVLDVYSDFINNFSVAMDLARSETVKKPALSDFFKARQVSSHDRMSFYGLMVKPVQRFPQFILFLQDLLGNTCQGHPERMSLQLALSQLEQLAEQLNERKRETEQAQAFRSTMRLLSAKLPHAAHHHKSLLRTDDVTQLEVNQSGLISKCKSRRLLLLNDQLICVSVSNKEENAASQLRLTYKWSCPIADLHAIEPVGSPTMSRLLTPSGSLTSSSSDATDSLCIQMSHLMHDYQVISRIHDLSHNLKGSYQELNSEVTRNLLDSIQRQIQRKDEQMAWLDSCCLQLGVKGKEDALTFQMSSQQTRKEWITELRLARLALDPNNSPAWEMSEQDLRPATRMPLFVNAHPVYTAQPSSEVKCGCFFSSACGKTNYLWVGTWDGSASYISVAQVVDSCLKPITQLCLGTTFLTAMEHLPATDTVWIGTADHRLLVYSVIDGERPEIVKEIDTSGRVISLRSHWNRVFVGLDTGVLQVIKDRRRETEDSRRAYEEGCRALDDSRRTYEEGRRALEDPRRAYEECRRANEECCREGELFARENPCNVLEDLQRPCEDCNINPEERCGSTEDCPKPTDDCISLALGSHPISALLPVNHQLFAACGRTIHVISAITGQIQKSYTLQPDHIGGNICFMAQNGVGLWLALESSSTLCLYHIETFKHLQDINVGGAVGRIMGESSGCAISSLLACKGLLWVGTEGGAVLTLPLPRLGGVPTLTGRISVAYHAHAGSVTLMLPLAVPSSHHLQAQDVYGLYGQLMTPRDPPPQHTLLTLTGGKGYTNYQQCCYKSIPSPAHILLWETKI